MWTITILSTVDCYYMAGSYSNKRVGGAAGKHGCCRRQVFDDGTRPESRFNASRWGRVKRRERWTERAKKGQLRVNITRPPGKVASSGIGSQGGPAFSNLFSGFVLFYLPPLSLPPLTQPPGQPSCSSPPDEMGSGLAIGGHLHASDEIYESTTSGLDETVAEHRLLGVDPVVRGVDPFTSPVFFFPFLFLPSHLFHIF